MFEKIDMSPVVLQTYQDSWFLWIGFFVVGFLLFRYAEMIGTTKKDIRKKESAGAGLIALSIVVHLGVLYALL